jgi:hypothetical protein
MCTADITSPAEAPIIVKPRCHVFPTSIDLVGGEHARRLVMTLRNLSIHANPNNTRPNTVLRNVTRRAVAANPPGQ